MSPRFVIQLHDATTLHYDLRLEVEGVLVSWAVPRGPSLDPAQKRLAVPVADHELSHGEWEGVLPDARRGSGAVIIWDEGTFEPLEAGRTARAQLDAGHLAVWLEGRKLHGGFALTRTAADRWILVKMRDEHAERRSDVTAARRESVRSGATVEELSARTEDGETPGSGSIGSQPLP